MHIFVLDDDFVNVIINFVCRNDNIEEKKNNKTLKMRDDSRANGIKNTSLIFLCICISYHAFQLRSQMNRFIV